MRWHTSSTWLPLELRPRQRTSACRTCHNKCLPLRNLCPRRSCVKRTAAGLPDDLVNPAQHMPEGTHVAVLSDVVNLITADRALHSVGAPAEVDLSSASDTDTALDDACYEEAVAALGLGQTSARNRKPSRATRHRRRPPCGATSTPARGGRQLTCRCPPRCRSRRRQVEAHAPTVG